MKKVLFLAVALLIGLTASASTGETSSEAEQNQLKGVTVELNVADRTSASITYHNGYGYVTIYPNTLSVSIWVLPGTYISASFTAYSSSYSDDYLVEIYNFKNNGSAPDEPYRYTSPSPLTENLTSEIVTMDYTMWRVNVWRN